MVRLPHVLLGTCIVTALAGCDRNAGSASCGIDALTGPLAVKQSFAEGNALTVVPEISPAKLPVRLVAGPAWRGTVTHDSTGGWRVTTEGKVSKEARVGYGVLVVDENGATLGVLAFDGRVITGAASLGRLAIGDTVVPLLGVHVDASAVQNSKCPVFPDSLR